MAQNAVRACVHAVSPPDPKARPSNEAAPQSTPARPSRSTRNQDVIYSSKYHPMDEVTRPASSRKIRDARGMHNDAKDDPPRGRATRHIVAEDTTANPGHREPTLDDLFSSQVARKRQHQERDRDLAPGEWHIVDKNACATSSQNEAKTKRRAAIVKEGAYSEKYHPMDASMRPVRAAEVLPKEIRDSPELDDVLPIARKRKRAPSLYIDAPLSLESEDELAEIMLDRTPTISVVASTPSVHTPVSGFDKHGRQRTSTPTPFSIGNFRISPGDTAPELHTGAKLVELVTQAHDETTETVDAERRPNAVDLAQRDLSAEFFDFESYEADREPRAADVCENVDTDGYDADDETPAARRRNRKPQGPIVVVSDDESVCSGVTYESIVTLKYRMLPENPWLQPPKAIFRHMTKLDKRLYNLQRGQPNDEDVLPLEWTHVVDKLVNEAKLLTFDDFERWGGMPALQARYEILRQVIQGSEL